MIIFCLLMEISSEKLITHTSPVLKTEHRLLPMSMFLLCQKDEPFRTLKMAPQHPRKLCNGKVKIFSRAGLKFSCHFRKIVETTSKTKGPGRFRAHGYVPGETTQTP